MMWESTVKRLSYEIGLQLWKPLMVVWALVGLGKESI
jgi:hypothetical protein